MEYKTSSQYYGNITPEQKQQAQKVSELNGYSKQVYDKWYNILTNRQLAPGYITVPEDDNEREIACQAANDIMKANPLMSSNSDLYARANSFARKCKAYTKKRVKKDLKTNLEAQKTGAAGFGQMDIQPKSTNIKDVVTAAKNAASQTSLYYIQGNQNGYNSCFEMIKPNLSNKAYNITYYYNFFNAIKDHTTTVQEKQDIINRLNSLKLQAEQYEMQANNNEFKAGAYDRVKENNQNTTQQVYNK